MRSLVVADIMTRPVVAVLADVPFKEIVSVMSGNHLGTLPVVDGSGRPIGVVSEKNLLTNGNEWGRGRSRFRREHRRALVAGNLMTRSVYTIARDESVATARRRLVEDGLRRLYVVDGSGKLVGVLGRRNVLSLYLRRDVDIRADIERHVLRGALGVNPGAITVRVHEGVVHLLGSVQRRSEVDLAARLVDAVPGVVAVHNELRSAYNDVVPQWA